MAKVRLRVRKPSPRIRSIRVEGFKSIVELTLELGSLNVLIGANGTGKTAVLEAIGLLSAAADGRVDDAELLRRGVRPGVPALYKSAFSDLKRIPRMIKLEAQSESGALYKVGLDNPKDSAATPWRFSTETIGTDAQPKILTRSPRGGNQWAQGGLKKKLSSLDPLRGIAPAALPSGAMPPEVGALFDTLRGFAIFDPQTAILRGTQPDLRQRDPLGLGGGRLAEAVAQLLTSARPRGLEADALSELIEWASDVTCAAPTPDLISPSIPVVNEVVRFTDRYMREGRNQLSGYDASEGALFVLFALAALLHPRSPRFFAIENIGHALHPRLARRLVAILAEHSVRLRRQVLITTHNPLVLDALDLANDQIRLLAVDRTRSGHTVVTRIAHSDALESARASGHTLSQMWTRGLLGAVPDLG